MPTLDEIPNVPGYARALIAALQLNGANSDRLQHLSESEWQNLVTFCDSSQFTLLLNARFGLHAPPAVRKRLAQNVADNEYRFQKIKRRLAEISECLHRKSIDFCVIKGFAHSPDFTPDPLLRAQGDIDLWCQPSDVYIAEKALRGLGYAAFGKSKGRHLDPLVHEQDLGWTWRGDYFARDLPTPVDLHYSLWDRKMEFIPGPDEKAWWDRRTPMSLEQGPSVAVLDLADTLTFAILHFLMHLFHGDLRLQRAWEIAHFLDRQSANTEFWARWQASCPPAMLRLQAVTFDLVRRWFACRLSPVAEDLVQALPADEKLWLERYAFSPIQGLFVPNKDELWLNLLLIEHPRHRARVFLRRVLPVPHTGHEVTGANHKPSPIAKTKFLLRRSKYHLSSLHSTCFRGLEWHFARWFPNQGLIKFLLVSVLFDFGEFIFFLLYNLYLLDRGFDEKFIGRVASALTAGSFAGGLPGSLIVRKFGLKTLILTAVLGAASTAVARTLVSSPAALIAAAFLNGVFLSFWAVSMPPAVASLTRKEHRTLGFSLVGSVGIGMGAVAGIIGGKLPAILLDFHPDFTSLQTKQTAILLGGALTALAIVPAAFLPLQAVPRNESAKQVFPNTRFMRAFLLALFVWTLGTGAFNPFFSVYFSKHLGATVEQIGFTSTLSQLFQIGAILLAPLLLRVFGDIKGIVLTQAVTAIALGLLATATNSIWGAALYVLYMSAQYMSEPCLLSMLMSKVKQPEQSGASALNFMVTAFGGILAAWLSGMAITSWGYPTTLAGCALLVAVAAGVFWLLLRHLWYEKETATQGLALPSVQTNGEWKSAAS